MKPVIAERVDANSESALLTAWYVQDGQVVNAGQKLASIETQKASFDIVSPADGKICLAAQLKTQVNFNSPIAYLAEHESELTNARELVAGAAKSSAVQADDLKITRKAKQLAVQYGVDLSKFPKDKLISEQDVYAALGISEQGGNQARIITAAGILPQGLPRILVLGAGLGAMQVIDILLNDPRVQVCGCLDDDSSMQGKELYGVPVWGGLDLLESEWQKKRFDQAIISVSTSIKVRKAWYERCRAAGIPLANAIDPTVRINRGAVLGQGNVICSQVHIGAATVLGDNNFISAHTNIDHHNLWGSHNTTGPNCATSSRVKVGEGVKFGTGVFMEPGISIGSGCLVASGAIITRSIPERHAVKVQALTKLVPLE